LIFFILYISGALCSTCTVGPPSTPTNNTANIIAYFNNASCNVIVLDCATYLLASPIIPTQLNASSTINVTLTSANFNCKAVLDGNSTGRIFYYVLYGHSNITFNRIQFQNGVGGNIGSSVYFYGNGGTHIHNYADCDFRYNVNFDPGNVEATTLGYFIASNLIATPFYINITNTLFFANNGNSKDGADISIVTNEQGLSSCNSPVHKTYLTITNSSFINTNQSNIKMDGDGNASESILNNNRILNRVISSGVIVRKVSATPQNFCSNNTLAFSYNNIFCLLNSQTTYNFANYTNIGTNSTDTSYNIIGLADSDKDGVFDVVDACPYDPSYIFLHTWESCNITTPPNSSSSEQISSHISHSTSTTHMSSTPTTKSSQIIYSNTIFGISKAAFIAAVSISSVVGLGLLMGGSYLIYRCAVKPKNQFKGPRNMAYEKELVT